MKNGNYLSIYCKPHGKIRKKMKLAVFVVPQSYNATIRYKICGDTCRL